MKKILLSTCFITCQLLAAAAPMMPMAPFEGDQKILVQNSILTEVNGTTISIMDVKKKLDVSFHQSYPQLADSTAARFQFYQGGWRHACLELIDHELVLASAEEKEIKVSDGEVREELENRFGPNVMITLDKIGISYPEAWKMIRSEMIVQRMMWYFVHSKAMQSVTPQDVRQEYRRYLKENPSYEEWSYRVISIRSEDPANLDSIASEAYAVLQESGQSPDTLLEKLKEIESLHPGSTISLSPEYTANHLKLSDAHRLALSSLETGTYSKPALQSISGKPLSRIFYLRDKKDYPAPSFDEMAEKLKNDLLQKAVVAESEKYIGKLRKYYGYDPEHLKESLPETLNPFSIQ